MMQELLKRGNGQRWIKLGRYFPGGVLADESGEQFGQPIQLLGADHQVHMRHPFHDPLAFLLGHTSGHPKDERFFSFFVFTQLSQQAKYFLLSLGANTASVKQHDIRLVNSIGRRVPVLGKEMLDDF